MTYKFLIDVISEGMKLKHVSLREESKAGVYFGRIVYISGALNHFACTIFTTFRHMIISRLWCIFANYPFVISLFNLVKHCSFCRLARIIFSNPRLAHLCIPAVAN